MLLTLPAELRNQIYLHIFTSRHHVEKSIAKPRATFPTHALSLLLTCRQIHHEAAFLAYSSTSFLTTFHRRSTLLTHLKASELSPTPIDSITSLTIAAHIAFFSPNTRALALFLENMAQVAWFLPALQEVVVVFECHEHAGEKDLKRMLIDNGDQLVLAALKRMVPSATFGFEAPWHDVKAERDEPCARSRGVYLFGWKEGGERVLRVEFLGFWPRIIDSSDASDAEVGEALAAESTPPAWELRRRERPFLTAGLADPAERMGRHRTSLGSTVSESPGSSTRGERRLGPGSPRNFVGLGSARSSLGGEISSERELYPSGTGHRVPAMGEGSSGRISIGTSPQ